MDLINSGLAYVLGLAPALAGSHPWILSALAALGTLVVVAESVVRLTPTPADDEALSKLENLPVVGKLVSWLTTFAVVSKK